MVRSLGLPLRDVYSWDGPGDISSRTRKSDESTNHSAADTGQPAVAVAAEAGTVDSHLTGFSLIWSIGAAKRQFLLIFSPNWSIGREAASFSSVFSLNHFKYFERKSGAHLRQLPLGRGAQNTITFSTTLPWMAPFTPMLMTGSCHEIGLQP